MKKNFLIADYEEYCSKLEKNVEILRLLKGKKFLITGITGQVGSYFAKILLELSKRNNLEIAIIGISRKKETFFNEFSAYEKYRDLEFVEWDVSKENDDISLFKNLDFVVHAASNVNPRLYSENPVETMIGNFLGTFNIFNILKQLNQKPEFLFLSTGEIYGISKEKCSVSESDYGYIDILKSRSCYPISKIATETLVISFGKEYGFTTKIARLSHVYGPTKNSNRVIDYMLSCGSNQEDIVLESSGNQERSYTYIGDVVTAMLYILLFGENSKAYNVSSDQSISILDLGKIISKYSSVGLKTLSKPNNDGRKQIILDNSALKKTGWEPYTEITVGIKKSIDAMGEF
ncbi:NAD-dependent epimerase/dehydratase family protein [Enterococcus faecium]|uniref:NAD-dependent epimerase/dehydratase family protein n=1 Tax=Enterococcus faecium TaxID=1352 RepID=UPI0020736912|nr:NAD-dependent epimerase/dehydratase family protein [Enterococcus faecium]MCM6879960.1 NAD-dependent epimerase/dehydratase family protein [Enterococcus faecium]